MLKFLKWLFTKNGRDMIMAEWLTEEESKMSESDPKHKDLYQVCQIRKQFDDNIRDITWIAIAIVVIAAFTLVYMKLN